MCCREDPYFYMNMRNLLFTAAAPAGARDTRQPAFGPLGVLYFKLCEPVPTVALLSRSNIPAFEAFCLKIVPEPAELLPPVSSSKAPKSQQLDATTVVLIVNVVPDVDAEPEESTVVDCCIPE